MQDSSNVNLIINKTCELITGWLQLKKKNVELEKKLESILSISAGDDDSNYYGLSKQNAVATSAAADSRNYMPRSCFEIKASNPNATTGLYFIDPDGQINGDDAIQVHCDMATRK